MTLILTLLSPTRVVQVSDRRLTDAKGGLVTDNANKAVMVWCDDAYFSVAYTGLAKVRCKDTRAWKSTDRWIADRLCSLMQAGTTTLPGLLHAFASQAEVTFAVTPIPQNWKGTKFVFAGFFVKTWANAFVGSVSNMRPTAGGGLKVEREFHPSQIHPVRPDMPSKGSELYLDGTVAALASRDAIAKAISRRTEAICKELERVEFEAPGQTDQTVAKELVSVVRMANRHPEYGERIGRDCMAVRIQDDSIGVEADTYKENSIMHDTPIMVTEQGIVSASWSLTPVDEFEETG